MLPKNNLEIMKNLLIILVFLLTSFISFGQNIDENGRLESQKLAQVAHKLPEVYLSELKEVKTATTFLLNYSLPEGKNNGEIKFFNPKKDDELKSIKVSNRKGVISVSTSDFAINSVVVGLYADGVFLESTRISF